jgi:predicted phage terminase large subunit-like protein
MLFQTKLRKDQQSLDHWAIEKAKGGLLASGVGGSITGEGADLFIIDDPFKGMKEAESKLQRDRVWEWYQSVVLTRLHPGAKLIIVLTRWHRDDLAGRILADPEEAKDWKVINLAALIEDENQQKADPLNRKIGQALWPMRYAASLLEKMRKRVGSRVWQSLYQGNPQDADSAKFKRFWFENNWYEKIPERFSSFCGIDTATSMKSKADNFAFVTVLRCAKTNNLYVHDAVCGKMSVTAFAKTVCRLDSVYNYTGGHLENNNAGEAIRQRIHEIGEELKKIPMIEARQTSTDKMVRAMEWQHLVENNTLKWNMSNPGVKELVEHILAFDGNDSDIDDDVDALGFAIAAATEGLHQAFYGLTPDDSYDPLAGSQ